MKKGMVSVMSIYEAIFSRRSVRKYRMEAVEPGTLSAVRRFLENITPLDTESRVEFEIIENLDGKEKIRGLFKVEAPYYLAVYCEEGGKSFRNAGYMAEQAVLYLTARELGTCYLGETKAGEEKKDGLRRFLVIAFGAADGKVQRDSAQARRIPLSTLCAYKDEPGEQVKAILKAARLAPSSFNSQPWRFVVYSDRIYIFSRKGALPLMKTQAALREFNMGIMLSHIMIAAEEYWMNMETLAEEQFLKKAYKNGEYICTIVFHS